MAFGAEERGGLIMSRKKDLGLSGRPEPSHHLLPSSGMAVCGLAAVVQTLVPPAIDARAELSDRDIVAAQLVGHQHPWVAPAFHQFLLEALGHTGISAMATCM